MADALRAHSAGRSHTPQSEPARADQVKNNAGGFTFGVSEATRLNRFLTLGTQGGTYYVSERDLTKDNAGVVAKMAEASDRQLITQAVNISLAGRAPSNKPALFALAAAASLGSTDYRAEAFSWLPNVARTGSHIMDFVQYAELFRGWGPQMVKGIRAWYLGKSPDALAYQLLKYKQREGMSQRDILRLAARKGVSGMVPPEYEALFAYVMKDQLGEALPALVQAAAAAHATRSVKEWVSLIRASTGSLSWEMLPSEALKEPEVWRALIETGSLPQGALIRQLPRLTTLGVLKQGDSFTRQVHGMLTDAERLRKARVHPVSLLLAMKTYAGGRSLRGKGTWTPVPVISDALDGAFYASFGSVEPSGKRTMIALDVSGSMTSSAGGLPVSCREVTAAVSMVVARTEPWTSIWGFTQGDYYGHRGRPSSGITSLDISPRRRLDDNVKAIASLPFGGTDCAQPMLHALATRMEVDVFQVWTDNETWAGDVHPHQVLENYRQKMGIDARMQVIGITATDFSIADPLDSRQLDVAGFDAAVPVLLANHARGSLDPGAEGPRAEAPKGD